LSRGSPGDGAPSAPHVGAAKLGIPPADLEITLVNRDDFHAIRVRNYEADLSNVRVALDAVLDPIGVAIFVGTSPTLTLNRPRSG